MKQTIAAIFASILQNKINNGIELTLIPALVQAGLPIASVEAFVTTLVSGQATKLSQVNGTSPDIINVGLGTLHRVFADSFKTVYLATIIFGGFSFIASFFVPDIDTRLTRDVVRQLGDAKSTRSLSDEEV